MRRFIKHILPVLVLAQQANGQALTLSLQDALAAGKSGNRTLQIEILEQQKLTAAVRESKSNLLPAVSVNGSYNAWGELPVIYLRNESQNPQVNPVRFNGRYAFDAAVAAAYPVLNPAYRSQVKVSKLKQQVQSEKVRATEQDLVLTISDLYYSMVLKEQQKQQLEQSLSRNQRALADARSLFLQGKALKSDTLASFISVQNLLAAISEVMNDRLRMESNMRQLLGFEPGTALVLSDTLNSIQPNLQVSAAQLSIALEDRPDMREQQLQLALAKEQRNSNRNIFMPQLWLSGQYQLQAQEDNPAVWKNQSPTSSFIGLRLAVPLYAGSKSRHLKIQSLTAIRQQEIAIADQQQRIEAELTTARGDLQLSITQWQIQQMKVQAAEVSYNMLHDRYKQGLSARLELSDAELSLTNARLNALQALYQMKLRELQYRKALGNLSFQLSTTD
jgi:outer membrane protein